jgi:hypothetical protein
MVKVGSRLMVNGVPFDVSSIVEMGRTLGWKEYSYRDESGRRMIDLEEHDDLQVHSFTLLEKWSPFGSSPGTPTTVVHRGIFLTRKLDSIELEGSIEIC